MSNPVTAPIATVSALAVVTLFMIVSLVTATGPSHTLRNNLANIETAQPNS